MKSLIALDLSTKPGLALFLDGKMKKCETLFSRKAATDFGKYPESFVLFAEHVVGKITLEISLLSMEYPDLQVVIEETTAGRNNYSQKILEFIHYIVVKFLYSRNILVSYVRTGIWRKIVGANLNQEEKQLNVKLRAIKKKTKSRLAKIEGKVVGKVTRKHSALRCFKEHFGYEMSLKDNDAVEAALLGLAFIQGAAICDGTVKGGVKNGDVE